MIAEIHGKISSTGSNLSDRLEDQLIGDVFGALRYLDARAALLPFLEASYFLNSYRQRIELKLNSSSAKVRDIRFWPWLVEAEPDVVVELELAGEKGCVVVIEAKYYSGLSSDDSTDVTVREQKHSLTPRGVDHTASYNQLIRQMRGMKKRYPGVRRVQIFLTADRLYPEEILFRVRQLADSEGLSDTELYWLSWHDLPAILECLQGSREGLSEREKIIGRDLLKLSERKGFARFSKMEFNSMATPHVWTVVARRPLHKLPNPIPIRILNVPKASLSLVPIQTYSVPDDWPAISTECANGK